MDLGSLPILTPPLLSRLTFESFGGALVWDVQDIVRLRSCRILGELIGGHPLRFAQHVEHAAPLALSPEEIGVACSILQVEVPVSHQLNTLRSRVFAHLWGRGYWIGKGTNFGADFVAYESDISCYHALYCIICRPWHESMTVRSLTTLTRLGGTVKKEPIIATEDPQGRIVLLRLVWKGI